MYQRGFKKYAQRNKQRNLFIGKKFGQLFVKLRLFRVFAGDF